MTVDDVLSDEEKRRVILLFAKQRGKAGFTRQEGAAILNWAHDTKVGCELLKLFLEDAIGIDLRFDGQVMVISREVSK